MRTWQIWSQKNSRKGSSRCLRKDHREIHLKDLATLEDDRCLQITECLARVMSAVRIRAAYKMALGTLLVWCQAAPFKMSLFAHHATVSQYVTMVPMPLRGPDLFRSHGGPAVGTRCGFSWDSPPGGPAVFEQSSALRGAA